MVARRGASSTREARGTGTRATFMVAPTDGTVLWVMPTGHVTACDF